MTVKSQCSCGNWDTVGIYQRKNRCTKCKKFYPIYRKVVIRDVLEPPHRNPRTGQVALGGFL